MKNPFSNQDAEQLKRYENKNAEQRSVIKGLYWQIEAFEAEREKQVCLLADTRELPLIKQELEDVRAENQALRSELAKAIRTRDNTRSAFERVKKQRDRLKSVQSVS
jgi:hypothetical protein